MNKIKLENQNLLESYYFFIFETSIGSSIISISDDSPILSIP